MYRALSDAMCKRNVSKHDIAELLHCMDITVALKIKCLWCDFNIVEAQRIHRQWFADLNFTELFTDDASGQATAG